MFGVLRNAVRGSWRTASRFESKIAPQIQTRSISSLSSVSRVNALGVVARKTDMLSTPVRYLNLHEYQSMNLFKEFGVDTPEYVTATTPAEAEAEAAKLSGPDYVVKAQVLAGGRGKGTFTNGFQGGVQVANSILEARSLAAKMLGNTLVTKQTGATGKPCNRVMITERLYLRRETYLSMMLDRETNGVAIIASSAGGMNIEEVAEQTPEKVIKIKVSIQEGLQDHQIEQICQALGFDASSKGVVGKQVQGLYDLFLAKDATLVEINPLAETHDGRIVCIDAKLNFDDNAEFRQAELFEQRDVTQEDPREIAAAKYDLNYIGLDGSIGCLVNGAGLAMATMDIITLHGGTPANFLDVGGGASVEQVMEAFRILKEDDQVKVILVNIFGGIMKCDVIALGIIKAALTLGLEKPIVVRLAGTNYEEANKLIEESGLRMMSAEDLDTAAQRAVRMVDIIKMAQDADLDVSFQLPM